MNKFEVKNTSAAPEITCYHQDLGLCYVSKFYVGLEMFYSIVPQPTMNEAEDRIKQAQKDLLDRGYVWNGKTL